MNERVCCVALYFDPWQPYKDDANYSITPFQLIVLNVPPKDRWDAAYSACLGLVPGSRAKGAQTSPIPFLHLIMDQLEMAQEVGIEVRCGMSAQQPSFVTCDFLISACQHLCPSLFHRSRNLQSNQGGNQHS